MALLKEKNSTIHSLCNILLQKTSNSISVSMPTKGIEIFSTSIPGSELRNNNLVKKYIGIEINVPRGTLI